MSHNVYKVAIQMARTVPSLKEETGVTGYHILYGYSLLFQMDEKTLNLLFSEEERADIEKARKVLEENEILYSYAKARIPTLFPLLGENSWVNVDQLFKGWRMSGMPFSSGELMRELLKSGKIELNWFKKAMDQEKYFKCLHELKQEKENRMKAQKDKASESDKTSESDEASGSKKSAELKETSGSEKIENAEKANHPGVKRSPETEKIDFRQLSVKYQQLTSRLLDTVKGQDEAVMEFVQGCFRGEVFHILEKRKRPAAVFLFAGPPGVGKTLLAETGAEYLGKKTIVFNMSEYSNPSSITELMGSSKKFSGAEEGRLVRFVRKNPDGILIFDEIEKADRKVIHLFLQILDRGLLHNDFLDQDEDFSESIIIFTSNAGKALYEDGTSGDYTRMPKSVLLDAIRKDKNPYTGEQLFPEAICSRIASGNIIMFNHLKTRHLVKMIETQFAEVSRAVEQRLGYQITYDKDLSLLFLYHYGGLTDARIASAQGKNFLEREIFELSRQLGNRKALMDQVENVHFKINKKEMPAEILKLFVNEKRAKVLVMCTDEEFSYFNEVNKIAEMIRVSERKEAEKLL